MTAEPSIQVRRLKPNDLFLIFASDGLWEQLNDEDAVEIVSRNPRAVSHPIHAPNFLTSDLYSSHNLLLFQGIAKRLVKAALSVAAKKKEMRYDEIRKIDRGVRRHFHDDITVIVVYLDHSHGDSSKLSGSKFDSTNAPIDIFSMNADEA